MKNTKRQAFTIVELVIVIAVIAILSAVLIPTFGSIIKNANIAADQATASTLTSELQVYLKGETIDSEEELMAALDESGVGVKLVPKSAAYGYNFWFNMKTQSFVIDEAKNIAEILPTTTASAEQDGPVLMADVTPRATTTYANVILREVYNNGYYFVDYEGNVSKALDLIDKLNSAAVPTDNYQQAINLLTAEAADGNAKKLATDLLEKIQKTTIRTQSGAFFFEGASEFEYISAYANYIAGPYYNYSNNTCTTASGAPVTANPVSIPSNIKLIMEGGMTYSAESAVIHMPSVAKAVELIAPGCTNAKIEIDGVYHVIAKVDCTEHGGQCDYLVEDGNNDNKVAHLELKLPFAEFVIGYDKADDSTHTNLTDSNEINKIYVAFRNGTLQLNALNKNNINDAPSYNVQEWVVDETADNIGTLSINKKTGKVDLTSATFEDVSGKKVCEVTFKATAKNIDGEVKTDTVTVVVIVPVSGYVKLGSSNIALGSTDAHKLTFNGPLTSYALTASVSYNSDRDGKNPLRDTIKPNLDVTCNLGLLYEDSGKLTFETDVNGKLLNNVQDYGFTVKIDNYYEATVAVEVEDATASAVKVNYNQHMQAGRPSYYVGSDVNTSDTFNNEVKLSDLFNVPNASKLSGSTAKVTIYYSGEYGGKLSPANEIHKWYEAYNNPDVEDNEGYSLDAKYDSKVTVDSNGKFVVVDDKGTVTTNEPTIRFIGNTSDVYNVFIEVAPEGDVSTVLHVEIVDGGINATTIDSLLAKDTDGNAIAHTTDLVLHANVEAETGDKIILGAKTLYGNGWIISAPTYKSTATSVLTDALISINGGRVDNVYIDGPVYPSLDYDNNTNGYYVSGVRAEGESIVSNSYISGFRQPVKADGTKLTVENTTLNGGNFANLLFAQGNLVLKNVTTVQNIDGMTATVDDTSVDGVIGVGIFIEGGAIGDGKTDGIVIDGYLDQYNWVKGGSQETLTMPSLGSLNTAQLFGYLFKGAEFEWDLKITKLIAKNVNMGTLKEHLHRGPDKDGGGYDQYVNASIVYAELTAAAEELDISVDFINDDKRTQNKVPVRNLETLDLAFSKEGMDVDITVTTVGIYIDKFLGTKGRFVLWSTRDGRQWGNKYTDSLYPLVVNGVKVSASWGETGIERPVECKNESTNYYVSDGVAPEGKHYLPVNYDGYYTSYTGTE